MARLKYFLIIATASFMLSCNGNQMDKIGSEKKARGLNESHISVLSDSNYRDLKFNIYCIFSGKQIRLKVDSATWFDFAECSLELDSVALNNDTLELKVIFYKNKIPIGSDAVIWDKNHNPIKFTRLLYDVKNNRIIEYITSGGVGFFEETPNSRYSIPLQPDVIKFIKENKEKLNPWYIEEVKRRKIIE